MNTIIVKANFVDKFPNRFFCLSYAEKGMTPDENALYSVIYRDIPDFFVGPIVSDLVRIISQNESISIFHF